jgi:hypothetical protein
VDMVAFVCHIRKTLIWKQLNETVVHRVDVRGRIVKGKRIGSKRDGRHRELLMLVILNGLKSACNNMQSIEVRALLLHLDTANPTIPLLFSAANAGSSCNVLLVTFT